MKKLLALLLALLLVVSLVACDSKNDRDDDDEEEETTSASDEKKEEEKEEVEEEEEEQEVEVEEEEEDLSEEEAAVAAWVEENGDEYVENFNTAFAGSSGLTCKTTMEANGCDIIVTVCINEWDDLTDEQKDTLQASYDALSDGFLAELKLMQNEEPAIDSLTYLICEYDGDVAATIYVEN